MSSILWINDFSGSVNQAAAPQLLAANQFKNLVNATQDEVGAVGRRTGSRLFLNSIGTGGTGITGLHMYQKNNANNYLHMIVDRDLYIANESTSAWQLQASNVVSSPSLDVNFENFLNRHYFIQEGGGTLKYATESGAVTTVSGDITGDFLAVNGAYLMVADRDAGRAKWSGVGVDTFADEDYVDVGNRITGVASFGSGRPFIVFTEDSYLIVDPVNQTSDEVKVGIGAVSHQSIANVRGNLVFLGREGFYALSLNQSYPEELSRIIRNDWDQDAYFSQMEWSNISRAAAVGFKDKYYCSVRNIGAVDGAQIRNAVLEFDLAQQNVKVHSFEASLANCMCKYIDSNNELDIYAGTYYTQAVLKLFVEGTYDDDDYTGARVNSKNTIVATKDFSFFNKKSQVIEEQQVLSLHFNYYATENITVYISKDGGAYEEFVTLGETASNQSKWKWIESTYGEYCKHISVKIEGKGKWMLYGLGFEIDSTDTTAIALS